jgi:uncharacterized membrane protein YoaK (UPF0700 family)
MVATSLRSRFEANVPLMLSFNGGYVDTMSFLALRGLFAAHVTGNFVTLGASLVNGTSGALAKLLALPVFCVVILAARLAHHGLASLRAPVLRSLLLAKFVLLAAAAGLAVTLGPFPNADSPAALLTGMTLVSAMAIQNAAHRVHMAKSPPSTLMTGTTTQIMLDVADLLHGAGGEARNATCARVRTFASALAIFAIGCGCAAFFYSWLHERSFFVPAAIALLALSFAPGNDT